MNKRTIFVLITLAGLGLGITTCIGVGAILVIGRIFELVQPGGPSSSFTPAPEPPPPDLDASVPADALGAEDVEQQEIQSLLQRLGVALQMRNHRGALGAFDFPRMQQDLARREILPPQTLGRDEAGRDGLKEWLINDVVNQPHSRSWNQVKINRLRLDPGRGEALAFARHYNTPEDLSRRLCWRLVKRGGQWRVYDFEEVGTGVRFSNLVAFGIPLPPAEVRDWREAHPKLREAYESLQEENHPQAREALRLLEDVKLPADLAATRQVMLAVCEARRFHLKEAVAHLDRAEELKADAPDLSFLRAQVESGLGESEETVKHARKYLETAGEDAETYELLGDALLALEQDDEAAAAFRKGLDNDPSSANNLDGLRRALPAGKKQELGDRLARIPRPTFHFEQVADPALLDNDTEALGIYIDTFRRLAPADPAGDYFRILLLARTKETRDAARLFGQLYVRLPLVPDRRQRYLEGFLLEMISADAVVEGYEAVPDADEAFQVMAGELAYDTDTLPLRKLLKAHRRRSPNDPWLFYYQGLVYQYHLDWDRAEAAYAEGAARARSPQDQETFRSARVGLSLESGRVLEAYRNIGPVKATFNQLANGLAYARDIDQMELLVAAHAKNDPGDNDLPLWRAEVHFLKKEYAKAVERLTEDRERILLQPLNQWRYHDRLIRGLVRLGRTDEALKALQSRPANTFADLYDAIICASTGDVKLTEAALERAAKTGIVPATFYADEDLGPLLRGEAFAALREKYPEPKPARKGEEGEIP